MKKLAAIFIAALMAASLSACGEWEIEIRNPYDSSSESSESSSSESSEESSAPEEEEQESEKIRVIGVSSREIDADIINEDGFGFGRGAGMDFQWVSETKAVLFSYKSEDPFEGSGFSVRVFLYDDEKKEVEFIKEFNFENTRIVSVYTREQSARIVFSAVNSALIFSVDTQTLETEEWKEDIGLGNISSKGLFAETYDNSLTVRDAEAKEPALYVVDVPEDYYFESWSPKGGYALLQKGYDSGEYLAVNLEEGITHEIKTGGYAQWCGEEGYIALIEWRDDEKRVRILDLASGETTETEFLDNVISYEKDFAIFFSAERSKILVKDYFTGEIFETGLVFPGSYGTYSAKYNPERKTVLLELAGPEETNFCSVKIYYGKEGEIPEIEPEPEKEPRPDSEFGIEPATAEETQEFMNSEKAVDDVSVFASWVGERDIESPKEVFSSYTLWWFCKELYKAMGEEEALYENEAFFKVDNALAERYFKRHFGLDGENIKDGYNYDSENGNYMLPVSGGGAPNKFLSTEAESLGENRVKYNVLLLIKEDETGRTFALCEMICDVLKDEEGFFLRLVSNKKTEEFGEVSFEDQAKYLTVRIVENLGATYVSNGIRVTDSQSVFEFICEMQPGISLGPKLDRRSPYIGDFYRGGESYHLPVSSMKKVAREVFGIGNFSVSFESGFEYDEEKDEYILPLEQITEINATASDLTAYVNGNNYTVRFRLLILEEAEGGPKWVAKDRYKMNFRLVNGEYLRFIGFDKA